MEMGDEGHDALAWNFVKKEYPGSIPPVCVDIFHQEIQHFLFTPIVPNLVYPP